ncbi:MAG: hypothetical protein AABZ67_13865 [Pseudomonadota bacterium]
MLIIYDRLITTGAHWGAAAVRDTVSGALLQGTKIRSNTALLQPYCSVIAAA